MKCPNVQALELIKISPTHKARCSLVHSTYIVVILCTQVLQNSSCARTWHFTLWKLIQMISHKSYRMNILTTKRLKCDINKGLKESTIHKSESMELGIAYKCKCFLSSLDGHHVQQPKSFLRCLPFLGRTSIDGSRIGHWPSDLFSLLSTG